MTDDLVVPPERLRATLEPVSLSFKCTDELTPLVEFVGQDRATRALEFGLGIHSPGYNVFVTGMTGTGKTTAILDYVRRQVKREGLSTDVSDWCYVFNFENPDQPNAIRLPAGQGRTLRDDLEQLLNSVRANISNSFSSDGYMAQRRELTDSGQTKGQAIIEKAQHAAADAGFGLAFMPSGPSIVPLKEGRPMTPAEFTSLPLEEQHALSERQRPIGDLVEETGEQLRSIEREVGAAVQKLDRDVIEAIVRGPFDTLDKKYSGVSEVPSFLSRLRAYTLAAADLLRQLPAVAPAVPMDGAMPLPGAPDPLLAFRVNLFVDNSNPSGSPIIVEANPTWANLFGRVDRRAYMGTYLSDHTMLKPGSAHAANGGYLIINFSDLISRPGAWEGLKRMIRTREIRLEDPMEQIGLLTPQTLRPEPIAAEVKMVVAGEALAYVMLATYDEEFWELFKVKADFDYELARDADNIHAYARFVCAVCEREKLRHFDGSAVARFVEYGSRAVEDQEKLSARFGRLHDLVVESDYWAGRDEAKYVSAAHVSRAIDERVYRGSLIEEHVREMISRGMLLISTEGAAVGQVNGLAVLSFGDVSFGRPMRITARTYLGQRGIVSIDRESQLSGKIHDKGVLILTGYLGWCYGQDRPLSLSATISFEQGYDLIDGDSASLAETCAILSALADIPLQQGMAITGSVNQKGEVQPIGGVNVKVEGFHDVCREIGFTGDQGVIIPARNVKNLMLRPDIIESVRDGNFRVFAVNNIDEALYLLSGVEAGKRSADGTYEPGTIHQLVDARLDAMAGAMRESGRSTDRTVIINPPEQRPAGQPPKPPKLPD
ncbi:MAG: ATP-binding protein [Chloroflexota bacterium]